ncbi:MAG: ABC transporter ATP-binding protein [Ignavibacteriae bacterium]|nr:MAG: ABC transporter ATP-binding protein [Ignavibacteriota bacterium]
MASIIINSLTYYYSSPKYAVFKNISLNLSTDWKLGLIGRNGKGKTTLLKLIHKELQPVKGEVFAAVDTYYFPFLPSDSSKHTFDVIRDNIAPFSQWDIEMERLLNKADEESIRQYGILLEQYQALDGFKIDALIEKETREIGISSDLLKREFRTLSGGEQTRVLLVSLFLKKNAFLLIDEPTNHLDIQGRMKLGEYLSDKKGYIVVSHDRYFLDLCIDHILSINKSDVRLNKGNYSQWKYNMELEEEFEKRKKENLSREVKSLEAAAMKRRGWANLKEKEIKGAKKKKGHISRISAKLMKRALTIESRVYDKLEEKKSLLKNFEKEKILKLETNTGSGELIAYMENVSFAYDRQHVFKNIWFYLKKGDRIAITGSNGSGKTLLLKLLLNELKADEGVVYLKHGISINYARQKPLWNKGYLGDFLSDNNLDVTKFRNILGVLGSSGEIFDRPLETFSKGEIKKVELCKSFIQPFDLLIWDEPLNYLDIASREQIEKVLLDSKPTMIFVEHDITFINRIATDTIILD